MPLSLSLKTCYSIPDPDRLSVRFWHIMARLQGCLVPWDQGPAWALLISYWSWWRHQMETFSALLAICAGNSPVPGEFPAQRPVTRSFDVFFDLRLNKRLSKQSRDWWFETPAWSLWRHRNVVPTRPFRTIYGNVTISVNFLNPKMINSSISYYIWKCNHNC